MPLQRTTIAILIACGCSSSTPDEASVCGEPPPLAVPILRTGTQEPLHWPTHRCVAVTHDGLSAARLAEVQSALDAWTRLGCDALCFGKPVASSAPIDNDDHRLHFYVANATSTTSTFYVESSGRIRIASLDIGSATARGDIVRQIGHALGLGRPPAGTDSVLAPSGTIATDANPTSRDAEAMCALYSRPPLCEP